MSFDILFTWLVALPGLFLPSLFAPAPNVEPIHQSKVTKVIIASPTPTPTLTPTVVSAPAPAAPKPSPKPAATPKMSTAPVAATAPTEIASQQVCPGQADVAKTTSVLVCLTSNARVFHGLAPVKSNNALMLAANAKAQDMNNCGYGHTACGRAFDYWVSNNGYAGHCNAENIAMGQKTPGEVFVAWMNSAGHRANILNKSYGDIGVSEIASKDGPLWVMELGGC